MLINEPATARILVVDDQDANVLLVRSILEESGYVYIETTNDSRQVLGLVTKFQPDLILLDLHMPNLDGYGIMQQLGSVIPSETYLPILVLTADVTRQAKQRALELGAKDFLTKPLDHMELLLRTRNLLETRALHLRQQNQNQLLEEQVQTRTAELREQTIRAEALAHTAAQINTELDLQAVLNAVCAETAKAMNVPIAMVALVDETQQMLVNKAVVGMSEESLRTFVPWPMSYIESLPKESNNIVIVDDVQALSIKSPNTPLYELLNIRTAIGGLIIHQNSLLGALNIFTADETRSFSNDEMALLRGLADQTAQAIANARLYEDLQEYSVQLEKRVSERTAELRYANEQLQMAHEDVTQALKQEKELNELKSRFLSTASHEFRTPLTVILSSTDLLERYAARLTEDKKLGYLHRIRSSVKHMTELVDSVLMVEKGRADRIQFNPKPLDIQLFCQELIEEFRLGLGSQHEVILTVEGFDESSQMLAQMDETLLQHILRNLLSNAIKYSPAGSRVSLDLVCGNAKIRFTVTDQGIGIPARDQPRLFESFHRASNVGIISGTGLGLSIVKHSVQQHGGTIKAQSQEGQGTTFIVELPLVTESETVASL